MPMSIVLVFFGHKYERERKREKGINRKEALEQKESDSDRDRIKRVSLFHGSHRDPDDPLFPSLVCFFLGRVIEEWVSIHLISVV